MKHLPISNCIEGSAPEANLHLDSEPVHFPSVGSAEWGELNRRRAELVDKEIDGTLSEVERLEYEYLQRLFLTTVIKSSPLPILDVEKLEQLRRELEDTLEQQPR